MLIYNIMYPQLAIKKINYIFTLIQNTDILLKSLFKYSFTLNRLSRKMNKLTHYMICLHV